MQRPLSSGSFLLVIIETFVFDVLIDVLVVPTRIFVEVRIVVALAPFSHAVDIVQPMDTEVSHVHESPEAACSSR